jgi:hypothetical protein
MGVDKQVARNVRVQNLFGKMRHTFLVIRNRDYHFL